MLKLTELLPECRRIVLMEKYVDPETPIKYKDKDGDEHTVKYVTAIEYGYEPPEGYKEFQHPAYKAAMKLKDDRKNKFNKNVNIFNQPYKSKEKEKPTKVDNRKEKAAIKVLGDTIKGTKFEGKSFIAGGYVRDLKMGIPSKDIDITVELPNGGIEFANYITKKLGVYKKGSNPVIYPTFGTAKFNLRGVNHNGFNLSDVEIESVMTRQERYKGGSRKPEVSPGTLKQDVDRRDFTVNSLLQDLSTGEIKDLTGMGVNDIRMGLVRTPLNPDVIFDEDPLRMLRAVRFATKYNWDLPMFMLKSMRRNAEKLNNISKERVRDELNKMLLTKNPASAIRIMKATKLLQHVLPELQQMVNMKQGKHHKWDGFKHSLAVLNSVPPKLTKRLGALLHDIGKPATKEVIDNEIHFYTHEKVGADIAKDIMTRLKYPKKIIEPVTTAVRHHMRLKRYGDKPDEITDKALRKLKRQLGDHLEDVLDVIHADNISHADKSNMPNQIRRIQGRLKGLDKGQGGKIVPPITGKDVISNFNVKPGPIVGVVLKKVQDAMDENPALTKSQALSIVDRELKRLKK